MSSKLPVGVSARAKRALSVAAVAGLAGLGLAGAAFAADEAPMITASAEAAGDAAADDAADVSGVTIQGAKDKPSSTKLTAAPLDTPQTITVVSERTLRDQNLLTLRDVLQTVPGITFGAGEGGGGYGDSINLRGYSANNDITTDGLRDSAQYSRTDTFNLQQIEIVNGANGVYSGSGGVGGNINLVSKSPFATDRTTVTVGVGTDSYGRLTVDSNMLLGDDVAVRLNGMIHANDIPGRDVETYERWGFAPSVTIGLGGKTQFTAAFVHQEDENTPRYGVPYASNAFLNGPLPGVDPSNYYGYKNLDLQEITVDGVTLKLRHEFSDSVILTNTARWQKIDQTTIVDAPQGTWCLTGGFNPQTGAACATPGFFTATASGPRGNRRDTENTQLINQTDLNLKFDTGPMKHNLVFGVSFSNETYDLTTGNILKTDQGVVAILPPMSIAKPVNVYTGPVNYLPATISDGELNNQAVYLFDNIEIGPRWAINGGIRIEHSEGEFFSTPYTYTPAAPNPPTRVAGASTTAVNEGDLVSYRIGLVFKPIPDASIYVAYGNVSTPSQATVNSGCSTTGANQNCDLDPEEGELIELGAKWDLWNGRLSLTGSVFHNERSQIRLNSNDPAIPIQQQDGMSRVRGATVGVSGQILKNWTVIANYTYLDSEVLQNVASTALPPNNVDFTKGDPIPLTPRHAFNVWTSWQINEQWLAGIGANYSGEYAFARANATAPLRMSPDYWVVNAAVTWTINDRVGLQLNVKNLLDEGYYTNIRSSSGFGWAVPGDARSATLTTTVRF